MVKTTRARNKIKQWFKAESRKDTEHSGRELLQEHLRKQGMPAQRVVGSPLLADDPIVGYISLGRGITIHRSDCPNARALAKVGKDTERFTKVSWDGEGKTAFKVEIHVDAWDRHRLLEDLSRTFAETGVNIIEARCVVADQMVRNRFVVEVGDTQALDGAVSRLRNIDAVFDAYRVTPGVAPWAASESARWWRRPPRPLRPPGNARPLSAEGRTKIGSDERRRQSAARPGHIR